jgi:MFS transporter, DHA3 family, macrolide efflux protein
LEHTNQWKSTFFKFWFTQALSLLGSGLASFSVIWWITEKTNSATSLAALSLATLLPGILLAPLTGVLVDQLSRKWILIFADAMSAFLALLLVVLFWTDSIQLWHIFVINILRGLAGAFQFPVVQASTSLMVPKEQLARISGLNQALQGVNMIATPPLAAMLLSLLPIHLILGIDVLTAIVAICLLFSIPIPQTPAQQTITHLSTTVWQDMRAGFAFLRNWPALINIMFIAALLNLVLIPAFTLVPILVTQHFYGSAFQVGWLNAAYGFGIIGGGAMLGIWGGFKRRIHTSLLGLVGLGIGCLMIGSSPHEAYWFAVAGMALVGIMNAFANGPFFAVLQSIIPPEMQGRVFTVLMSVSMAAAPIGLVLAGPLADNFGVQFWYILSALLCGGIVLWILLSPAILHLEENHLQLAVESPSKGAS